MQAPKAGPISDPRHEIARYANEIYGVYSDGTLVHLIFGLERPVDGQTPGPAMEVAREVVARIVLPRPLAIRMGEALALVAKGQSPSSQTGQH